MVHVYKCKRPDILRQDAFLVTEMHDGTYETTYHNLLILRKICINIELLAEIHRLETFYSFFFLVSGCIV